MRMVMEIRQSAAAGPVAAMGPAVRARLGQGGKVSRMAGWTAHAIGQPTDHRLIRPDSEYIGERGLTWIPLGQR